MPRRTRRRCGAGTSSSSATRSRSSRPTRTTSPTSTRAIYVISYLRAWAFAAQMTTFLREEFGTDWFRRREAGVAAPRALVARTEADRRRAAPRRHRGADRDGGRRGGGPRGAARPALAGGREERRVPLGGHVAPCLAREGRRGDRRPVRRGRGLPRARVSRARPWARRRAALPERELRRPRARSSAGSASRWWPETGRRSSGGERGSKAAVASRSRARRSFALDDDGLVVDHRDYWNESDRREPPYEGWG